ncbi:hypothetical protein SAMN05216403_12232 [Nitrosospira multiformis ATCC 25196]|uniref:Lipoprotein n=1 Tax=Nitrosospira multiformis (strain ATCC 25196 / NCIMB 11849 / C 71) TaxID=323848 RepID=Q2YD41_NITMU|nr:hypothetical protein Nmul_A0021 [Nitrosospira multiformis ATCC 25196]SEG01619.1 hypothetical protein SAMN05216403_12232 [Nitrosospira multiformis ATCC 25196]
MKNHLSRLSRRTAQFLQAVFLVAALGILLGSCDRLRATPINEVNTSPANFDGKEVVFHGVVTELTRIPLIDMKSFILKDESGEIAILTDHDLPKSGQELSVKVKVQNLAIINGEPLGTTITEIERQEWAIKDWINRTVSQAASNLPRLIK